MKKPILIVWLMLLSLSGTSGAIAAFEVYQGDGMMCTQVVSQLQRDWMELRRHLLPMSGHLDRPKDEDFVCVSRRAIEQSRVLRSSGGSGARCFQPNFYRGGGFCCDNQLQSCAALNPGLFPELQEGPGKKASEPQKSIWVRPPSEEDQWKSN